MIQDFVDFDDPFMLFRWIYGGHIVVLKMVKLELVLLWMHKLCKCELFMYTSCYL
ncbi:hypothetical protein HanRHA438_Chr10g0469931 [Helianthus annuus]|nr:hypothetical protein HanRHA438_Chr10g0469931 [Helianthus annuus]